jgi:EpsI family protein
MTRGSPRYVAMLVLLSVAAIFSVLVRQGKAVPLRRSLAEFPYQVGNWKGLDRGRFPEEVLKVLQASDYLNRDYQDKNGTWLNFYIGYYEQQRAGESMHSPKNCLPGSGWEVLESTQVPMEIPQLHKTIQVNHYVVQNETSKSFVLYWYDTHGRAFASEYQGKAILVWEALKTGRTDGSLIRVLVPYNGSSQRPAEELATAFARQVYPQLRDYLPE